MRAVTTAVLGAGSWGTTVASLAAANVGTRLWARSDEVAREINEHHTNNKYLPGFGLPPQLTATTSMEEAVWDADVLVIGVPSHCVRPTLQAVAPYVRPWIPIVSLTKGLEQGTLMRMTEVIDDILPGHPVGVLAGPNLAQEVMAGYAAATVIAMPDDHVAKSLQSLFASRRFRVYTNDDVLGCELGGALKNVIAIAAGMGLGLGVGDNTRAMVITRGLAELTRLGIAMGGNPRTFAGLSGLGDLMATCMSPLSRNRHVGEQLAKGKTIQEVSAEMNMVAEGIKTCAAAVDLAAKYDVMMPICLEVYSVCHQGRTASQAYRGLSRMPPTSEIHGVA